MTEVKYTKEQEEAIYLRGKNILVSAAAGSGKTKVLVDRIVRLVTEDRVPLSSMLVVTFTNAAAKQMQERVQKGLMEALNERRGDTRYLIDQLNSMAKAHISTMHAFCIDQIRENFQVLDVDPNFAIVNPSTQIILQQEALETVFEKAYNEKPEGFLDFVEAYGSGRSDRTALDIVLRIYRFIMSQPEPFEWLREHTKALCVTGESLPQSLVYHYWMEGVEEQLLDHRRLLALSLKEIGEAYGIPPEKTSYPEDLHILEGLLRAVESRSFDEVVRAFGGAVLPRYTLKLPKEEDPSTKNWVQPIRNEFKSFIQGISAEIQSLSLDRLVQITNQSYRYMETVRLLVENFAETYDGLKKEKKLLDFNDLEHHMLTLLKNEEVTERLRRDIRYIFFDEYQDSNPVQERIIESIKGEDNLFFVGDVKQSIYRFRLSDPTLFNRRYDLYSSEEASKSVKIDLSKNFRSRGEILDFCNFIFHRLMTRDRGEVDYTLPGNALVTGNENFEPLEHPVEIVLLEGDKERQLEWNGKALWIGKQIKKLVEDGLYRYKDIAVLMRSLVSSIADYEECFRALEIPFYSDFSTENFQSAEVSTFIDMMRVVDNSQQDKPLISVLLSAMGGFDEEALSAIRIAFPDVPFWKAFRDYGQGEGALAEEVQEFYKTLERYRFDLRRMTLEDFGWHLLRTTGYHTFLMASDKGKERLQNVYAFIEKMGEYEADSIEGLHSFLSYVDRLLERKGDDLEPAATLSEEDDVVRIMTIHKSKGLEFPVVFLSNMEKGFNTRDLSQRCLLHNELGIGWKTVDLDFNTIKETLPYKAIVMAKGRENKSEEVRLLYVAMTRAVDRLYLVGQIAKPPEKKIEEVIQGDQEFAIRGAGNYLDWVLPVALRDHSQKSFLEEQGVEGRETSHAFPNRNIFKTTFQSVEALKGEETFETEEGEKGAGDSFAMEADLEKEIHEKLSFQYPYEEATQTPYKKTVTQTIKKDFRESQSFLDWEMDLPKEISSSKEKGLFRRIPAFLEEGQSLTPTQKGSLTHFIFQNISLQPHTADTVAQEIQGMVQRQLITSEQGKAVDQEAIVQFFQTELGKEILRNKATVEREVSFTMKYEGLLLDGQIDLFFESAEGYVLVDFKTDSIMRTSFYAQQLELYSQALEKSRGKKVRRKLIYWTRFNQITEYE